MQKPILKMLNIAICLCMLLGLVTTLPNRVIAKEQLVNVARDERVEITADNTAGGHPVEYLVDGDDTTSWQRSGFSSNKDASVQLKLAETGTNVSKVVVKVGGNDVKNRTMKVNVYRAQNGITTDLISIGETTVTTTGESGSIPVEAVFELSAPVAASHIVVVLSQPTAPNGGEVLYWPSIHEIEVYEMQDVKLSEYNNIASQAEITTDGYESAYEGKANLVDENYKTLYKFHDAQLTEEKYVELNFGENRSIDAFELAFEQVTNEPYDYRFVYSIYGKNLESEEYELLVDHDTANRTDKAIREYKIDEKLYSNIKIVMHETTNNVGNRIDWPAIAEFKVFGSEKDVEDTESIAFRKPVHSNSNAINAKNVNDGNVKTAWNGNYYPGYVDIDLEENYYLDAVEVYTPVNGYSQYSIYTSMNGRDFDKLAEKTSTFPCTEEGERYPANRKEARIVRVYMEYNSANTAAILNEVRVMGEKSGTQVQTLPEIDVTDFSESTYADTEEVTNEQTYEEVYGIIERRLGTEYRDWFTLEIKENPNGTGYDFFELSDENNTIKVSGNDGVSLATGINHYLKYYCNVNISQVGDQVTMPETVLPVDELIHKETKAGTRYSYNYCTLSYSMAFWGEEEWRNELDWLALNGVNVVLDATAQEEVWRRFLGKLGYTHQEIKDYIAGPAYYAWAYMANLTGFGGPIHDSWFEERTELARKNQLSMRRLGMQPVLQGYSGMVPTDIREKHPDAQIIEQGTWCSFRRPDMLHTESQTFKDYAALFYESQKEVYGTSAHYYATDPFHEGGNTGNLNPTRIAQEVMSAMLKADEEGIWIIQSWQGNPTSALLRGLEGNREHALVLDLYADKDPHYDEGNANNWAYGYEDEFDNTPWVFCMLNNFGGRLGLHGHLDNLANNIPKAMNNTEHMAGIGITPEASVNNPVLYDFLFETVWTDNASEKLEVIDLDAWLKNYARRRYGVESESAYESLLILKDTVYKADLNMRGQGAPESVVNARPALNINAASTWGNAIVGYDKVLLETAAKKLLEDYDLLKDSAGYRYDLATLLQQVLSNSAQEFQIKMASAFKNKNLEEFNKYANIFMDIIDCMEDVTSTSKYYLLGTWVEQAKALAANADDFTKDLYEFNAKALVTTWGSYNQAETGGLKDYSNRQWSGLLNDFYKARWQMWINERVKELNGESYSNINWFEWEWKWARENTVYSNTPNEENIARLDEIGEYILINFSVKDPNADASNDLPLDNVIISSGSEEPQPGNEDDNVIDNNASTIWHSKWSGSPREDLWIQMELPETMEIDGIRALPRKDSINGFITKYRIEASNDGVNFETVSQGNWDDSTGWKLVKFENKINAKYVRLYAVESKTNSSAAFASLAEFRLTNTKTVDKTALTSLIETASTLDESLYTEASWSDLAAALENAETVLANAEATQEEVNETVENLEIAMANLEKALYTVTVNGEEVYTGAYNEKVTVTAPVVEGKTFTAWLFDGKVISTEETYTFFLSEDTELTASYEEVNVEAEAILTNTILTKRDTKADVKFVAQLVVPEGYTVENAGLVWSSKEDANLSLDNENLKPTYITRISNTNQFSVTIKGMPAGRFIRGKIFATLVDSEGNTTTVYSEEARVVNR